MKHLETELEKYFGFKEFNPGQKPVVSALLEGQSAAALFPTGAGKSLCYQLPAMLLPGLTLVVSPLIALMKDQLDALTKRNIPAARLDSTLSADEYRDVIAKALRGELKLLYVAPERFNNERFRESLSRLSISLMAIDEAHCISEWGHNFRPDYLKLANYARQYNIKSVLALTATATPVVAKDIRDNFNIEEQNTVRTAFHRPNLHLLATASTCDRRSEMMLSRIKEREAGSTIIYVTLQKTADDLAEYLQGHGLTARAYHAGMKDEVRVSTQEWFMQTDNAIVVATIAFGMGIDKANIRYIYHYNLPKSMENYAQEIGRAGRDGKVSICECFVCSDDLTTLENFIYGDTPSENAVYRFSAEIMAQSGDFDLSVFELSNHFDIRPLVIKTLLTYLELEGYIEGGTPIYSIYQFKPVLDSKAILSHFEGEQRKFISQVLSFSKKGRIWFKLELDKVAQEIGCERQKVVRAMDYLAEQGWLQLEAKNTRLRYTMRQKSSNIKGIADSLNQRMKQRERSDLQRLQEILVFMTAGACMPNQLSQHFGEALEANCGHCSYCSGSRLQSLSQRSNHEDAQLPLAELQKLLVEHADLNSDPRLLAKFFCGLNSPYLVRSKLSKHPLYGEFSDVQFASVLATVTQQIGLLAQP